MPYQFTRRQFIRSGILAGAGFGMSLPGLARLQNSTSTPAPALEGDAPMSFEVAGSIRRIHDPVMIKAEDTYYLFCTGQGILARTSPDMINWEIPFPPVVFGSIPPWARELIPGQTDVWAPDISYYNDKFHLYYAVSTFGKNRSVIGLATNTTLNPKADGYKWVDEGLVLESVFASNYNCIDPNLALDADGVPWLAFGSFWSGIKMRRLDYATGKPSEEDTKLYALAQRTVNSGAVEAPFIIHKNDFYYLFVSFDFCCRGVDSDYHVVVGRSENIIGPYVDRDGLEMLKGGGTQVTFPTERWRGPGHNAILQENGVEYIVYHAYDAENQGVPTLRIDPLVWDAQGWPSIPPKT
jgi:arabinan endo-1,5-alpha-L-arabinosidase